MAAFTAQDSYNWAKAAGDTAYNRYLKDNPGQFDAAKEHAARMFDERHKEFEDARKGKGSEKPSTPTVVYDPFNRLTPTRIDKPAADYSSILNMQNAVPEPVDLSSRRTIAPSSVLPAHVQTMNAFMTYISGLDQQGLLDLKAHLFSYRDSLKTQPATAARNLKIREVEGQVSRINQKLPESVRYDSSSVASVAPSKPLAPVTGRILCRGMGTAKRICNPGERPSCTRMLPVERNTCMCCPSDRVVSDGTAVPVQKIPTQPEGITVSTMPIVDTGNEGVRAELNAPILDLYSAYADRGYAREAEMLQAEIDRVQSEIRQPMRNQATVSQSSYMTPVTSQPTQQQFVVATETDYSLQPMPTMPSPVETVSLEEAATGRSPVSPVTMSARAKNASQPVNWWLLGGLGVAALVFFGGKAKTVKRGER